MDDNVPEERELALKIGSELVLGCSELWAFGIDHPSAGMVEEIELAKAHGIPVRNGFEAISELKPDDFFTPSYIFDFFSELQNIPAQVRDERKKMLFSRFGIDKFSETKISDLSTGMKQKTSIAVSLVHDPEFIIFDEPTNGLDVLTAKAVTDFLVELRNEGKSILLSTHIFSLVEKICDRVGVIIDGKMTVEDTVKNLTAEKGLEDVFFDIYAAAKGGNSI